MTRVITALVCSLACSCATSSAPEESTVPMERKESGPLLLENVRVWGHPDADAVLVAGKHIEKIGDARELRAWTASSSMDMKGGLLVPGFHDGHVHMLAGGLALGQLDLAGARTLEDTLARVKAHAAAHPDDAWIVGRGWSYDIVPKGTFPTAAMLEVAAPGRAVVLESYDGHTAWLSAQALALSHIAKDTPDPKGGTIARDASGAPTGALLEGAMALARTPAAKRADKKRALEAAARSCVRRGVTAVDAMEAGLEEWALLLELEREGKLPLQVNVFLPLEGDLDAYAAAKKDGTDRVRLVGTKGFVDGVVEAKTAYLKDAYAGTGSDVGRPLLPPARLFALVEQSARRGLVVALHAIGDGAVSLSLDAFERASKASTAPLRHRVEHIEVLDPHDAARFARVGAVASMQPYHAVPGEPDPNAGAWSENLGAARLRERTFAWRTLVDAGATLSFGSDWPVFTHDPLAGLAVALSRKNENGAPKDGWNAHQKLTPSQALNAYARGRTVNEGQLADLVVLPASVKLEEPATLWGAAPLLVLVGGDVAR